MRVLKLIGLLYSGAGIATALAVDRMRKNGESLTSPGIAIVLIVTAALLAWNVRMYLVAADEYSPGNVFDAFLMPIAATACFLICLIGMFLV